MLRAVKQVVRKALKASPAAYRLANRIRGHRIHDPDVQIRYEVLGSNYGGWAIPSSLQLLGASVISVGVGEDITFDRELELRGAKVWLFDPTPAAIRFMETQPKTRSITFSALGLAALDGPIFLYAPKIDKGLSFARPKGDEPNVERFEGAKYSTLVSHARLSKVDILKIDIEGSEFGVIDDILLSDTRPKCLLAEFHHGLYGYTKSDTRDAVRKIRSAGFDLFWVSDIGHEYGFIRR